MQLSATTLCLILGSATGFMAPVSQTTSALSAMSKSIPFLEAPAGLEDFPGGEKGFDPLGLSKIVPIKYLREAELKHGRVAMLATVGWIVADFVKLPGEVHQVSSLAAHDVAVESGAMTQMLIWIGAIEAVTFLAIKGMIFDGSDRQPGEYMFDPLFFGKAQDPDMQLKEIENGRLAMLAFSGIVTQAAMGHETFPYM